MLVCQMEETPDAHVHDESCYEEQEVIVCGIEEAQAHIHGEDCYEEKQTVVCGQEEAEPHIHDESCMVETPVLLCAQEESEGHVHGDDCWVETQSLTCETEEIPAHFHEESCWTEEQTLTCTEESEEHTHGEGCYEVTRAISCGLEETEGHTHGESCWTLERTLGCGQEESEGHTHTEECWGTEQTVGFGIEETEGHVHTEECLGTERTLVCGMEETEGHVHSEECRELQMVLICETEQIEGHVHTEECYDAEAAEPVLVCEVEEHEHSLACYSDPTADVESASVWEATLPELTGVWADDVIAIAKSQLGYQESSRNYIVLEDGVTVHGYTRYGEWYGDAYGDWCAMFASFCIHYAQVEDFPLEASCSEWVSLLQEREAYSSVEQAAPQSGDLVFFDKDADGSADHVGIVTEFGDELKTIEGNAGDCVAEKRYETSDGTILGYGSLPVYEIPVTTQTAQIYTDGSYRTLSGDETVISVTGAIPTGAEIRAYPVTIETEQKVLCAYDITIYLSDGSVFEPEGGEKLTVSIQSPELSAGALGEEQEVEVYYVPEEGEPQWVDATTTGEGVSFDADHFSVYAVMAVDAETVSNQNQLKAAFDAGQEYIQLNNNMGVYINNADGHDFGYIEGSLTVPAGASITLDLNGCIIWQHGTAPLFVVPAGSSLTIVDSQAPTETVTSGGGSLSGNAAEVSTADGKVTLTYYVTTTSVTDSTNGLTSERLEKHTVVSTGTILANDQTVFQVSGNLTIQSGVISGGTGRAIRQTGGTVDLLGGYICGFTMADPDNANTGFGGAVYTNGGTLNLNGGVLAGNTAPNGGAVYASGATVNIKSGVVSGNLANRDPSGWDNHSEGAAYRCGGGGIYTDGASNVTMSGGYITNNEAYEANSVGYFDGGGGIFISGTTSMTLSGGYVTGNVAQGGGGIRTDFGKATTFTMTGGYITNNEIEETVHWGGGGFFCAAGSTVYMKNLLVTQNDAGGFGGGVAGCPTGSLYLYVNEGCASFDNEDVVDGTIHWVEGGSKMEDKELCDELFQAHGHEDYFCAMRSTVTCAMLGGYSARWEGTADGSVVIGDTADHSTDVLTAEHIMGLTGDPTAEGKAAACAAANLYITGNYSYTHGGGIMCNGNLIIGNPEDLYVPARIELQASKTLEGGDLAGNDFSFVVTMTEKDGTVIANGVCDSAGNITFDHQLTYSDEGTHTYYIYEVPDASNASIDYDSRIYRLTVTVERDNGVTWHGDAKKFTYSVTSVVVEVSEDGGSWEVVSRSTDSASGVISLPLTSGTTFVNKLVTFTSLTVRKQWEGGSGTGSVTVILKADGVEVERQVLSAGNNWSYTWTELEAGPTYSVEEVPVEGYTTSYDIVSQQGDSTQSSLGQGSWWVPAASLTEGARYMIVSPDGTTALYLTSEHSDAWLTTADTVSITAGSGMLTVGGETYSSWYDASDTASNVSFTAQSRTKDNNTGLILKSDAMSSWILIQSSGSGALKSTNASGYASFAVLDGGYLRFHFN